MRTYAIFPSAILTLASMIFVAGASGQDRPVRRNKDFNPQAVTPFDSFNTGVIAKIKSAAIAKDGTIVTQFTLTDANGAGLDYTGALTPGAVSMAFVAAYIPNDGTQYTAYTTTSDKATANSNPPQIQAGTDSGGTLP